jgi:hypothetical protein
VNAPPAPEVLRCFFHPGFQPHLAAMTIRWPAGPWRDANARWRLPTGLTMSGPAPERFGFRVDRLAQDSYQVCLLWQSVCLCWSDLSRADILSCCLASLLEAIHTDLGYLLDQPVASEPTTLARAA